MLPCFVVHELSLTTMYRGGGGFLERAQLKRGRGGLNRAFTLLEEF